MKRPVTNVTQRARNTRTVKALFWSDSHVSSHHYMYPKVTPVPRPQQPVQATPVRVAADPRRRAV